MPKLQRASIDSLRPTQLTVGMLEVEAKRKHLGKLSPEERDAFLESHSMPVVLGPQKQLYITDHHHLARAALDARVKEACFKVMADFSSLSPNKFWLEMDEQSWVHPLDEHGVRHDYSFIPATLKELADDVYRSLAGFVRDSGGFKKTDEAFVEFIWADFFRRNIAIEEVKANFPKAVAHGMQLAKSRLAKPIPGYTG